MTTADWYFDFISPYAYFGSLQLEELSPHVALHYRPVLFAGLLNHWGHKGPAEIPAKREWTLRWCTWWAQQQGIPFRFPAAHPFNPIPYLRLALAVDCEPKAIHTIFASLWTTGVDADDPSVVVDLAKQLGVDPLRLEEQAIKDALKRSSEQAIACGVFGVPSLHLDDHLFWGADANELIHAYLADHDLFTSPEMLRVRALPVGTARTIKP